MHDPAFQITSFFGRLFLMAYVVCMVIVALNMLVAMMNNSFQRIMVRILYEEVIWWTMCIRPDCVVGKFYLVSMHLRNHSHLLIDRKLLWDVLPYRLSLEQFQLSIKS